MAQEKTVQANEGIDNPDVYLVIADETDGFQLGLRYAANRAKRDNAHLAILYVMDEEDFQHWGNIEERIHNEYRAEAERILNDAALKAQEYSDIIPCLYIREGGRFEKISEVINNDPHIRRLILGAEAHSSNPGPLVSYFTGKGLSNLGVTLTIIPGNLTPDAIQGIF